MLCSGSFPLRAHFYSAGEGVLCICCSSRLPWSSVAFLIPCSVQSESQGMMSLLWDKQDTEVQPMDQQPHTGSSVLFHSSFLFLKPAWKTPTKWLFVIFVEYLSEGAVSKVGQVSQVHLKNGDFVIDFNRIRIFTLSCKRNQLYITDFYCIS